MLRKTHFVSISVLLSEIVTFWSKKRSSLWISAKNIKTTEKHSLAVCGTVWGEIQKKLIFVPFHWFDQKELFRQIQIFLRICPFSNMLRKTNFVSISLLLTEIVTFWSKKKVLCEFPPKCFKTIVNHSLAVCCSLWGEKKFLFYICSLSLVWSKTVV